MAKGILVKPSISSEMDSYNTQMYVGDVVIIKDENVARNVWRLGRIIRTYIDEKMAWSETQDWSWAVRTLPTNEFERVNKLNLNVLYISWCC